MLFDPKIFQLKFDIPVPSDLAELYINKKICESMPLGFRFTHVQHILEIQHLMNMSHAKNYDIENFHYYFAVNTDGRDLIVDLNTDSLEILQLECGELDSLDINLKHLLKAEVYSLTRK